MDLRITALEHTISRDDAAGTYLLYMVWLSSGLIGIDPTTTDESLLDPVFPIHAMRRIRRETEAAMRIHRCIAVVLVTLGVAGSAEAGTRCLTRQYDDYRAMIREVPPVEMTARDAIDRVYDGLNNELADAPVEEIHFMAPLFYVDWSCEGSPGGSVLSSLLVSFPVSSAYSRGCSSSILFLEILPVKILVSAGKMPGLKITS